MCDTVPLLGFVPTCFTEAASKSTSNGADAQDCVPLGYSVFVCLAMNLVAYLAWCATNSIRVFLCSDFVLCYDWN
jgi:hypothetical protein